MKEFDISGDFMNGLNTHELMKQWECAMSCVVDSSSQVWKTSYLHHNIASSLLDLIVNHRGQVYENRRIIAENALSFYNARDFASDDAFAAIVHGSNKFQNFN